MPLTIIVPVFNAREATLNCLASLERCNPQDSVIVIDDASTDAALAAHLDAWVKARPERRLIRHTVNLGFVHAVNQGMQATDADVVLLNSDTLVTHGWLAALERCLHSASDVGTATPWTNNGEIVSYPQFCRNNPAPVDADALAEAVARSKTGDYPELPTAVGFCMAIPRVALDRLGYFDAQTFGLGYGEENDFSCRVTNAGMRNLLCDDAYVVHVGGASFTPLGLKPDGKSMQRLLAKHPEYLARVQSFIKADPLASRRAEIDRALSGSVNEIS